MKGSKTGYYNLTVLERIVKVGVVVVKALDMARRAGISPRAKMQELEELLARRGELKKHIEGGLYSGFRTLNQNCSGIGSVL